MAMWSSSTSMDNQHDVEMNSDLPVLANVSGDTTHSGGQRRDPILSDEARRVLEIIFYSTLGSFIGVAGSATNVINIIVFVKQGFNDSVSISLCALAVSDLGFLLPMIWVSICSNPLVKYSDITFDTANITYITGGLFESCFVRITNLITAFITFERCVCIALPLKVKDIITPKRTLISIVAMYVIIFATNLPTLSYVYLAPAFNAERNKTLISFVYTSNTFENFASSFNVFAQLVSFTFVICCTVILVLKMLAKSQWRQISISASDVSDSISTRDKKVIKMVTLISTIFIIFYFSSVINLIFMVCLSPEYSATGSYENSYLVSWAIIGVLEGINSSITIIIYYNMSSTFRETFNNLFLTATKSHRRSIWSKPK